MNLNHSVLVRQVAACGPSTKRITFGIYTSLVCCTAVHMRSDGVSSQTVVNGPLKHDWTDRAVTETCSQP